MEKSDVIARNNITISGNTNSNKTIIFIHGFGTDQTSWELVSQAFEQDYKVVKFDNVGAGNSQPEAFVQHRYLKLSQYADDLIEICESLELSKPIVVGHSVGGIIAALASIKNESMFSKLVLIGASPRYLNDTDYNGGFMEEDIKKIYTAIFDNHELWAESFSISAINTSDRPDLAKKFAQSLIKISQKNTLTILYSILHSDHREDMKKISIPTLIVYSSDDNFVPMDVSLYLHDKIKNSTLVGIKSTGHFPQLTAPNDVINALLGFL